MLGRPLQLAAPSNDACLRISEVARITSPGVENGWDGFASPGGHDFIIVNRNSGDSMTVDTKTWTLVPKPPFPAGSAISGSFDRSGKRVLTIAKDGTHTIWSWPDRTLIRRFPGDNSLSNPWAEGGSEFFENSQYLVTAFDSQGRLWDLAAGKPVGAPFPGTGEYVGAADVPVLFTHLTNEYGLLWDLDVSTWFDQTCTAAGRNMTLLEWERNGPRDSPYQATCPQWPSADPANPKP